MPAIITSNFRTLNARHFKEQISGSSVYVGIGKSDVWSLTTADTTDESVSPNFLPEDQLDDLGEARASLIGLKKIIAGDIAHVVPRHTWSSGREYVEWDSNDPDIFDKAFYIVTSEFKVYKCIKRGGGVSSIQPTQTLTDPTTESDGYTWKFMYTISVTDAEKFLTNSYMPVKTVPLGASATVAVASSNSTTLVLTETVPGIGVGMRIAGSGVSGTSTTVSAINGSVLTLSGNQSISANTIVTFEYASDSAAEAVLSEADFAQYLNQKASRDSSTAAGIERVEVSIAGSGYSTAPTAAITGDGTGAALGTVTMAGSGSNKTVASIAVSNKGTNYRVADITLTGGGGSDAAARAVIAPKGGHGVDPVAELGGFFISLNTKLDGNDGGDLTTGNDFRQIVLVNEPRVHNANPLTGLLATDDTLKATKALVLASGGTPNNYQVDELIVGGTSGAQAYIVEIDTSGSNLDLRYHQNSKTGYKPFVAGETVTGQTSNQADALHASAFLKSPEVDRQSGDILFLENRSPISRTDSQIEDIKVIIEF